MVVDRGSDVIKALALGAKGVLEGRPCIYGLAVAGERGGKEVLRNMIANMDITMAVSAEKSVSELNKSLLIESKR